MKITTDPRLAYLLVNLATLLWASNIALGRAMRDLISPVMIVTIRASIAGVVFLVLLLTIYRSQLRPHTKACGRCGRRCWRIRISSYVQPDGWRGA